MTRRDRWSIDECYRGLCLYIADLPPTPPEYWREQARRQREEVRWWRTMGSDARADACLAQAARCDRAANIAPIPREYWLEQAGEKKTE